MRKYLYVRVSTTEQNETRQLNLKEKYNLRNSDIFIDKSSGKNFDRPAYKKLKDELRAGDSLIVMSLDRLGKRQTASLKRAERTKRERNTTYC